MNRWTRMVGCVAAAGVLGLSGSGCLYYGNYPPEDDLVWWNSRESAGLLELMEKSLGYVIELDLATQPGLATPPAGEPLLAVNLPGSISPESYRRVAKNAHPLAVPLSELRDDLPVYHIGAVRLRGGEARVHVLRPVTGLERGSALNTAGTAHAGLQLWFEGGSGDWKLSRNPRQREPGTLPMPRQVPIEALERKIAEEARGGPPAPGADSNEAESNGSVEVDQSGGAG
ncbi:MAG: hypothetical protein AAGF47_04705 [Planctomycetota bacterium]